MGAEPKLWVVLGRPVRLANALIAARALYDLFPGGTHLVRDDSQWWDRANWQPYHKSFAGVHAFPRVKTSRGLFDLMRLYRDTVARKSEVAKLPIDPERDVLLSLASVVGLANAVVSAHRDVYKILCISKSGYENITRYPDRMRYRFTTSGWLQNRVVEPLAGVERTLNFKPRVNPGGDGVRLIRLQKAPTAVYDSVICMSSSGRELPVIPDEHLIPARFPAMRELPDFALRPSPEANTRRRVLFFGTPFLLIQNLAPEIYLEHLDRALDYLRRQYPSADLVYRPHPVETTEATKLRLDGFRIEDDREAAELYFMRHYSEIEAVYSVSSGVSRTALNYGLNAYTLWRTFPFPGTAATFFEKAMGDVPPEFEIRDLTKPPIAYQSSRTMDPGTHSFGDALKLAVAQHIG
jgi:hypothetical protein